MAATGITTGVDELAVYDKILTATQVTDHYNAGKGSNPLPPANVLVKARGNGTGTVSWQQPVVTPSGRVMDSYQLVRKKNGVVERTEEISPALTSVEQFGMAAGASYTFEVAAKYGDFTSASGVSNAHVPADTSVNQGDYSFAVGTAYKAFKLGALVGPEPAPCGPAPGIEWDTFVSCNPQDGYGSGLVMIRNNGDRPMANFSLNVAFDGGCSAYTSIIDLPTIQPGMAKVVGGYMNAFDTMARCFGKAATVTINGGGQSWSYRDSNLAFGVPGFSKG